MNYRLILHYLGVISLCIGVSMGFCIPWALPLFHGEWVNERDGVYGLFTSILICVSVSMIFLWLGRTKNKHLLRRESIAVVGLSWILATFLGALPYLFSDVERSPGVKMNFADACFESQSGFSTTGATVFNDLENPATLPRTILFWRCMTHFLGGLGIILLFIVLLGHSTIGKTMLRAEQTRVGGTAPQVQVRQVGFTFLKIYLGLVLILSIILLTLGVSLYDTICHAFSTVSTGGFSTFNDSVGHFANATNLPAAWIEMTLLVFMALGGTNFTLFYWVILGQPQKLFRNTEWRTYLAVLGIATLLVFISGMISADFSFPEKRIVAEAAISTTETVTPGQDYTVSEKTASASVDGAAEPDFPELTKTIPVTDDTGTEETETANDPSEVFASPGPTENNPESPRELVTSTLKPVSWITALRYSLFHVVSIMTSSGFRCVEIDWNAISLFVFFLLMCIGGCAGSTAGGSKVIRSIIAFRSFQQELEYSYRPNVVRTLKLDGQNIERDTQYRVFTFLFLFVSFIVLTALLVLVIEPESLWIARGLTQRERFIDAFSDSLTMYANIGMGFGIIGGQENYAVYSDVTKFIYIGAMLLGRIEFYSVLVLFMPSFWKNH